VGFPNGVNCCSLRRAKPIGASRIHFISGHDTGALRAGLGEFLKTYPLVEAHHSGAGGYSGRRKSS
jgi:hypothetical protein